MALTTNKFGMSMPPIRVETRTQAQPVFLALPWQHANRLAFVRSISMGWRRQYHLV